VKRSLSADDYQVFFEYSRRQDATETVLEWLASRPDLTNEQIRATWNEKDDGPFPGLREAYGLQMAKLRDLRAGMAFRRSQRSDPPEELLRDTETLDGWKKISRRE
jgi:hypothetical protein